VVGGGFAIRVSAQRRQSAVPVAGVYIPNTHGYIYPLGAMIMKTFDIFHRHDNDSHGIVEQSEENEQIRTDRTDGYILTNDRPPLEGLW
jgi:hypothetical protein